ncbi:MAG TPA: nitrilase-related carbon-nitrogen hydrolase [Planctomycetota bacterium]|nr:nitrilase-related carbon-nitrogen hydrolase [Planctomycetota bacterium]
MDCRITLSQINPTLGNLTKNLELHVAEIEAAKSAGSQLVLFPELSLSGYFLKDQTSEIALRLDSPLLKGLAEQSRKISIAAGFVERSPEGRLYNSIGFFEDGALLHVHRKVHLVTYGMFDEQREFAAGDRFVAFESKLGRFGFLICEDLWHVSSAYPYFLADVDLLLVHSCAPGRDVAKNDDGELGSQRVWQTLLAAQALTTQTWVVWTNRVGWEDGIFFSGGSRVVDPFGRTFAMIEGLEPGRLDVHLTSRDMERARLMTPLRRDAKPWLLEQSLARHRTQD